MTLLLTIAGLLKNPLMKYVGFALAVILTFFLAIQYIQRDAREELLKDIKIEQVQDEQETTERITDAVDEVDSVSTDADSALEWLLRRQLGE